MPRQIRSKSYGELGRVKKSNDKVSKPRIALIRYGKTKSHDIPCMRSFSDIEKERIKNSNNVYVDPSGELHCLLCIRQHKCAPNCPCKAYETFLKYDELLRHIEKIHRNPTGDSQFH